MAITRSAGVTLGRRDGRAIFGDALPCGTRFCPNCGPRIQAARRDDLRMTVESARAMGWATYFLTLTISHSAEDRLVDLLDALDTSWRAMTRGGFWNRLKKRHGLRHFVRVTEEQQGGRNGWHPHNHVLLFLDPAAAADFNRFVLEDDLLDEWSRVVDATGYRTARPAQLLIEPTPDHLSRMAAYFSKMLADGMAWEMTGSASKQTRGESRNPAQLLVAAVENEPGARDAWVELEQATKGRRTISWSVGARRDLRLPAPAEHADVVREDPPSPLERIATIPAKQWHSWAARAGFRDDLATVVAAAIEYSEVVWWLHDRGITASGPPELARRVDAPPEVGPVGQEWLAAL